MEWNKIKLVVYDFDGVMTDNRILVNEEGIESAYVNRSDGLAIANIKKLNIDQIIISTEQNPIVIKRATKLDIPCFSGVDNKLQTLIQYLEQNSISKDHTAFVGNDLNDKEVMEYIAFPIAPSDAYSSIRKIALFITEAKGGYGVIREIYNFLENCTK